ncbi:MAG: TIGR02679 domain-containing protein [Lachnospiraceae bacterium]|nr:TIGR02679 domain-containing protein [Lachnospiraceae bacterium]
MKNRSGSKNASYLGGAAADAAADTEKHGLSEKKCEPCIRYFREHPVLDRLLNGFREKYLSYGSFSGSVVLRNLKEQDREDLEGFLRKNYHGKKSATVRADHFRKALSESRFGEIAPDELLRLYFGENLIGKKERKLAQKQAVAAAFERMEEKYAGTPAGDWIRDVRDGKTRAENCIRYMRGGNAPEVLVRNLDMGAAIVNAFPVRTGEQEYLAVFAAHLTGNPHAFDDGTEGGQLLAMTVSWEAGRRRHGEGEPTDASGVATAGSAPVFPALQRQRQYLAAGILRDDMSNYAMIFGIRAFKKGGSPHAGIEGFLSEGEPVQVPLSVIAGWERIECPQNAIYIVENPSVYALLCHHWRGKRACMCMNGQPRLSAVLILDLLAKAGVTAYYAGDFDPEGLLIAQKVKQYYEATLSAPLWSVLNVSASLRSALSEHPRDVQHRPLGDQRPRGSSAASCAVNDKNALHLGSTLENRKFFFWHMSEEDALASLSDELISDKRMKMLDRITDADLQKAAEVIRVNGVAGYQENIYERYLSE